MGTLIKSGKGSMFSDFFDIDRFFDEPVFKRFDTSVPAVNVKESDKAFTLEVSAPGFQKDDLHLEMQDNMLRISASRKEEKEEKNERYTRKEFSASSFSRSFTLPSEINPEKIEANYANGILKVEIPKNSNPPKDTSKKIKIN